MFDEMVNIMKKHGYEFVKQIGKGCFATCYLVFDRKYNKEFICKACYTKEQTNEDKNKQKFYHNEIDALINVVHPNIVKIYNYFSENNYFFIILEYCKNLSLDKYIYHHGGLSSLVLYDFIVQFAVALQYIHSIGIAHHDIKPANLLLDEFNKVKLADFGFASIKGSDEKELRGSLAFIPPEKLTGQSYDPFASDTWSFGVSVYYLAFGALPFPGDSREEIENKIKKANYVIPPNAQEYIKTIIQNTLVVDPSKRMTMDQVVSYLKTNVMMNRVLPQTKSASHVRTASQFYYHRMKRITSNRLMSPVMHNTFAEIQV